MPVQEQAPGPLPTLADYEVVGRIGDGNHGNFFVARPPARLGIADELVSVKVFAGHVTEDAYRRGARELRAFAAVDSPYLATVYDAVLDDRFFYAMEHFPLGSLAAPATDLDRDDVLTATEHAALAVHALHEAGMAHGDVKPANVMITGSGSKLSDLGLARVLAEGAALTGMAPETSVAYVDPELLMGAPPSRATDIWGLGATLHHALTGAGLYGDLPAGQPMLAIRTVLKADGPTVSDALAPAEAAVVRRCLAPIQERYATALEVAEDIAVLRDA